MNYIVFDLEWNQCPYGKDREVERLPFEIIEIGAVKLNQDREKLDEFHRIIKPAVYKKLHFRTKEVIRLDAEMLSQGISFPVAVREFLNWCGPESTFATWGSVDLIELQRNMKYYGILELLKGPLHYYDVQKLFSRCFEDGKSRKSLKYGIDFLNLEKQEDFHQALADASYTAQIFQRIDPDIIRSFDSIDCYQNPKSKKEEIHAVYRGYIKYISREFDSKEEAAKDREVSATRCCICGRNAKKKIRWFSVNAKNYYSASVCPEHGLMRGKNRMKKTDEGKFFVVKTIRPMSEEELDTLRVRREQQKKKRRRK